MTGKASLSGGLSLAFAVALGPVIAGCGADDGGSVPVDTGGATGSGGTAGPSGGSSGTPGAGGVSTTGGATNISGATSFGGMPTGSGGAAGMPGSGGTTSTTGGATSLGGTGPGGTTGGTVQSGGSGGNGGGSTAKGGTTGSGGSSTTGGAAGGGGKSGSTGGASQGGSGGMAGTTSTGGSGGACTLAWEPPATLTAGSKTIPMQSALDSVYDYLTKEWSVAKGTNWITDQIIANKGTLNYCVRIDLKTNSGGSGTTISEAQRAMYQTLLETWINNWTEKWLTGWGCWPYGHIPVKITGWAVPTNTTLTGTVDPSQAVYVNQNDRDGIPQCPDACYRNSHKDGNYSGCTGGAAMHWDLYLHLQYGMGLSGFGYDWGQQMDLNVSQYAHILGHEMGHGFGLPDFYSGSAGDFYTVETGADAQALKSAGFIMQAGSAAQVSTFDGWMLRQNWYKFERARHGF